jgi:hypothetical protein
LPEAAAPVSLAVEGCVGCHQTRGVTPNIKPCLAASRLPRELIPPPWGDETVSFPRFVQPVLDRHCVKCHNAKDPQGGWDLAHRTEPGTRLSWPYVSLVFGKNPKTIADLPRTSIAGPIFPYHVYFNPDVNFPTEDTVTPPMTAMSYRSRLIELAAAGKHYDVSRQSRFARWRARPLFAASHSRPSEIQKNPSTSFARSDKPLSHPQCIMPGERSALLTTAVQFHAALSSRRRPHGQ